MFDNVLILLAILLVLFVIDEWRRYERDTNNRKIVPVMTDLPEMVGQTCEGLGCTCSRCYMDNGFYKVVTK